MTKVEELEKAVLMLEEQVATNKKMSESYQVELDIAKKALADFNKPELTSAQFDMIYEVVESGVDRFDWNDTDNFDIEYGIDYDGRVNLETHEFRNSDDLVQMVCDKVCKLFKEADCPENDNSQLNIRGEGGNVCKEVWDRRFTKSPIE